MRKRDGQSFAPTFPGQGGNTFGNLEKKRGAINSMGHQALWVGKRPLRTAKEEPSAQTMKKLQQEKLHEIEEEDSLQKNERSGWLARRCNRNRGS